ncbi:unnamed protein product [Didymodactylos carnosus]|uniref:Glycolipid transfer protein domain-containing protein n=1 Tax=Didymodactylos carnosus TaxID=1234261 RepID=A0A813YL11_9BILA|nr:unnamed protein product [Didymodactylos carnosus]CAF3671183.1 unnamed protein product [Didymodactylos carnosus]
MASTEDNNYSLDKVYNTWQVVLREDGTVLLPEFIAAFRELIKFFDHLNIVFSFVSRDLVDKFVLIENLCKSEKYDYYKSVQTMLKYETSISSYDGTIALLRLLRALEFTYKFLQRSFLSETTKSTKTIAYETYKESLYKRHSKAVQWAVWAATNTLPKQQQLKQQLLKGEKEAGTVDKTFPIISNVYSAINNLYTEKDLLELVSL